MNVVDCLASGYAGNRGDVSVSSHFRHLFVTIPVEIAVVQLMNSSLGWKASTISPRTSFILRLLARVMVVCLASCELYILLK